MAATEKVCSNCRGPNAALKCGVCKKTYYCSGPCQREDWPFHKRNCTKPAPAIEAPPPLDTPVATPSPPATTPATPEAPPQSVAGPIAPAPPPSLPVAGTDDDLYDEDDRAAMAAVRKMGYRYAINEWQPSCFGIPAGPITFAYTM